MTRTDVHSPTNLVTEDYDFITAFDSEFGFDVAAGNRDIASYGAGEWEWDNHPSEDGWQRCTHCGQRIRYCAVMAYKPTQRLVLIGETCLSNRFSRATADFQRLRKQAKLDRERQRIKNGRLEWFAINPDREVAFAWATERVSDGDYGYEGMRHNFVHKINRYGSTSDKFVSAILRDMVRTERRESERAAEKAELKPVVTGKGIIIEGEVLSVKWQDNEFGGRFVSTVKDDRGFIVWGSRPSKLAWEKGDRVRFKAGEIKVSDRDETFGFYKRSTSAEVL